MEVVTCRNCGKIFNYVRGQLLCPTCQKELDTKFRAVKKYVYEHPRITVKELSEEMEVSVRQINAWVREERLTFADDPAIGISCEKCGASIRTGRFCERCKAELTGQIAEAAGLKKNPIPAAPTTTRTRDNKMRFLDNK